MLNIDLTGRIGCEKEILFHSICGVHCVYLDLGAIKRANAQGPAKRLSCPACSKFKHCEHYSRLHAIVNHTIVNLCSIVSCSAGTGIFTSKMHASVNDLAAGPEQLRVTGITTEETWHEQSDSFLKCQYDQQSV
jgi:hypothetical protein